MSKPKPPPAPDPAQLIRAQTEANTATAAQNAQYNRVNERTPYGSVDYSQDGGGNWTRTTSESDAQRSLREAQERQGQELANLGISQTQRVGDILSKPFTAPSFSSRDVTGGAFDPSKFGEAPKLDLSGYDPRKALGDYGSDVETRTFDLATRGMDRAFGRAEEDLRTRLANQGITQGSDAFGAEFQDFNVARGDAYARALLGARDTARADRGQAASELGMGAELATRQAEFGTAGRNQAMADALMARNQNLREREADYGRDYASGLAERQVPLSEITSIMSGLPIQPINPGAISTVNVAGVDTMGAYGMQQAALQNAYNQKMAGRNAVIGGLAGLGGAWLGGKGGKGG